MACTQAAAGSWLLAVLPAGPDSSLPPAPARIRGGWVGASSCPGGHQPEPSLLPAHDESKQRRERLRTSPKTSVGGQRCRGLGCSTAEGLWGSAAGSGRHVEPVVGPLQPACNLSSGAEAWHSPSFPIIFPVHVTVVAGHNLGASHFVSSSPVE